MAYKDEYEVARLLTKPTFESQIRETWTEVESISYNLHPPMLRRFGCNKKLATRPLVPDAPENARLDERPPRRPARYFRTLANIAAWSAS